MNPYIKKYNSINEATSATNIISPNISKVSDGTNSKCLMLDTGTTGEALLITGTSLNNLNISVAPSGPETWYFNSVINAPDDYHDVNINFTSNDTTYTLLEYGKDLDSDTTFIIYFKTLSNYRIVYLDKDVLPIGWSRDVFRTITLETPATGDFLTFLLTNAVKQS